MSKYKLKRLVLSAVVEARNEHRSVYAIPFSMAHKLVHNNRII